MAPERPSRFLSGLSPADLESLVVSLGERAYRGRQIFEHIHARGASDLHGISVLPAQLRVHLNDEGWRVHALSVALERKSADGTVKMALRADDGAVVETVLIGMETGGYTQCMSSQVGCALACDFCVTGSQGFTRDMTVAEIVDQYLLARRLHPELPAGNLVFMGMGEPLNNFDNVSGAIRQLQQERGCNISPRRITVSTAGIVPGIERMGKEVDALLAVSLNAPTQAKREAIMPIARRYPLDELMAALKAFPVEPRRKITIEYVLLHGVNDSLQDARNLVRLLSFIRCKVNLIPYNPAPEREGLRPSEGDVQAFAEFLASKHVNVTVRKSRGQDIEAACGQLAGKIGRE